MHGTAASDENAKRDLWGPESPCSCRTLVAATPPLASFAKGTIPRANMSSDSTASSSVPTNFTLTGGVPRKSQDLAPSILFAIAFFFLVPLLALRFYRKSSRTSLLISPAIFICIRIATYVIFLLCGYFLLVEPFCTLVKFHMYRNWTPRGEKDILSRILLFIRLSFLTIYGLSIYVGSKTFKSLNDPELAAKLNRCRYASGSIALAIVIMSFGLVVYAQISGASDLRRTIYLGLLGICMLIMSVYKIVLYAAPANPFSRSGKAVFYIINCLPELLATLLFLSINLETEFELREGQAKEKWNSDAQSGKVTGTYSSPQESNSEASLELQGKERV
ncbi:uncharacterized protein JCM15063_000579 [Sporobolomyces koalae]|uniref:uncharacterized protein n=1 Tax=Sporobolomyces koalae TaxID=500713 RepID=UPI003174E891